MNLGLSVPLGSLHLPLCNRTSS